jgi:hypothetical protein
MPEGMQGAGQEIAEHRRVAADEAPGNAEQQQRQHHVAERHVQVHVVEPHAHVGARQQHNDRPMEDAHRQVPDAHRQKHRSLAAAQCHP